MGLQNIFIFIMVEKENYDYLFKFIIIGDASTGKSCLLHQFIKGKFKKSTGHTNGVEFGCKMVTVGKKTIKLQIWDTAGQERFKSVTRSYYRGAAGALIVYDITQNETFNNISNWINDARSLARPDISMMVVGNKLDLKDDRNVAFLDASKLCQENDVMFMETSALTGENVDEAFMKVCKTILYKIETGKIDPNIMM